jgi:radical SAM superfamily enzyme YgiQ (UPF0313 family)
MDLQIGSDRVHFAIKPSTRPGLKVTLVRPPLLFAAGSIGNEIVPSIGLAYINGYLRKFGYEPTLIDGQGDNHNIVTSVPKYPGYLIQGMPIEQILLAIPPDTRIFGVTAMFSAEWPLTRDLINAIKAAHPLATIIAGGEHISAESEYCLKDCAGLDICVRGEGEHVFLEACESITDNLSLENVPSITYRNADGEIIHSSAVTRMRDIDAIPWPYWPEGYLEKFWKNGKSFGVKTARDMPILMTRGCPYQCTFCSNKNMWTTRYVMRSIDDIVNEVVFYYKKYNVTSFQVYDLTAITKKKWFVELLNRLIELQLPVQWSFPSGTRSEVLDEEVLRLLKAVNTTYLCYAPESGSAEILKKIKKQIDLEKMILSIRMAKKLGLNVRTNFIIGFPDETRLDIFKTFVIALRCAFYGVDDIQPYLFNPYPGSQLFQECRELHNIKLSDAYFLTISRQNSDILSLNPVTFNTNIANWELAIYRLAITLTCYGISYLFFPKRILRTIKNLSNKQQSDTVLEARLQGILLRKKVNAG